MSQTTFAPIKGQNLISGLWTSGVRGGHFPSHNPARLNEVLGEFPCSTPVEAGQAVQSARTAFPAGVAPAASVGPNCSITWPKSSSAKPTTWHA